MKVSGKGPQGPKGDTGASGTVFTSIVSGVASTSNTSSAPLVIGSAYVDPATVSGTSFAFEAILNVTGGGASTGASIVLYNMTTGTSVATLTSTSTSGEFVASSGVALPGAATHYEARLFVTSPSGASSKAAASMVRLRFY